MNRFGLTFLLISAATDLLLLMVPGCDGMQIFVKVLRGDTITLDVQNTDTVASVKARLTNAQNPEHLERLLFKAKPLEDEQTLANYQIGEQSVLHLVAGPPPPNPPIFQTSQPTLRLHSVSFTRISRISQSSSDEEEQAVQAQEGEQAVQAGEGQQTDEMADSLSEPNPPTARSSRPRFRLRSFSIIAMEVNRSPSAEEAQQAGQVREGQQTDQAQEGQQTDQVQEERQTDEAQN